MTQPSAPTDSPRRKRANPRPRPDVQPRNTRDSGGVERPAHPATLRVGRPFQAAIAGHPPRGAASPGRHRGHLPCGAGFPGRHRGHPPRAAGLFQQPHSDLFLGSLVSLPRAAHRHRPHPPAQQPLDLAQKAVAPHGPSPRRVAPQPGLRGPVVASPQLLPPLLRLPLPRVSGDIIPISCACVGGPGSAGADGGPSRPRPKRRTPRSRMADLCGSSPAASPSPPGSRRSLVDRSQ